MNLSPVIVWMIIGLVLTIAEMFTLSFFLLFFGVAAFIVALVKNFTGLDNVPLEIVLFALLGLSAILVFRKKLLHSFRAKQGFSADQHKTFILDRDLPPHGEARIDYSGSTWTAVNDSNRALVQGEKAVIVRTEGIKLFVRGTEHLAAHAPGPDKI